MAKHPAARSGDVSGMALFFPSEVKAGEFNHAFGKGAAHVVGLGAIRCHEERRERVDEEGAHIALGDLGDVPDVGEEVRASLGDGVLREQGFGLAVDDLSSFVELLLP